MVFSTLAKTEDIHGREHNKDVVSRIAINNVYRSWQRWAQGSLHSLSPRHTVRPMPREVLLRYLCPLRR